MLNIKQLKKYYNGKKVFVTGHDGFKGSYMCVLLNYLGAKVYGYSLKASKNELYETLIKENKKLVCDELKGDVRDYNKLKMYLKKVKPDYVLHMAAQPLVLRGYDEPLYTYEVNVMGTANLMQAVYDTFHDSKKIISILNVTTDKGYENNDLSNYAFKETDKLCGRDPYANSKSCSELITYAYNKSFFHDKNIFRISTARAGNVIGGGDLNKNRIIPDCYRAIKSKSIMEIRNPNSIRPYQYVLEPLILYLNIMAYQIIDKKYEGNYNIGPDKKSCLKTYDLTKKFIDAWEKIASTSSMDKTCFTPEICLPKKVKTDKHEAEFLRLDNSLIKKTLGYKEIYKIDKTMEYTATIYYAMLNKKKLIPLILSEL